MCVSYLSLINKDSYTTEIWIYWLCSGLGNFQIPNTKRNENTRVKKFEKMCTQEKSVRAAKVSNSKIRENVWCVYNMYVRKCINIRENMIAITTLEALLLHMCVARWPVSQLDHPLAHVIDPELLARDPVHRFWSQHQVQTQYWR